MNPLFLGPILEVGKTLLDRFVPDPEKRREAEAAFLKQAMDGELKQVIAQLEINEERVHRTSGLRNTRAGTLLKSPSSHAI